MLHPYNFVRNGTELINLFVRTVDSIKNGHGSVKFDGVNTSIKFNGTEFTIDRGSTKELDINGVKINELSLRWPEGHGMIPICKEVLTFFNKTIKDCTPEYVKLGITTCPNILINMDYVDNKTNVIQYDKKFIIIHDLKATHISKYRKDGITPASRSSYIINYNQNLLDELIKKLNIIGEQFGIKVLGRINVKLKNDIDIIETLKNTYLTLSPYGTAIKQNLYSWLNYITDDVCTEITKKQYMDILNSQNVSIEYDNVPCIVNGAILMYATLKIGQYILENTTSSEGDMINHEGIVIRDNSILNEPYKITGNFIINGLNSPFRKK